MNQKYYLIFFSILLLASCRKDKPAEQTKQNISISEDGVYIINQGNFQFGNAKVSYYNPTQNNVTEDLFAPANNRPLGDVLQSMYIFNGRAYLVLNNSNKIEVVNLQTFVSEATISGFTSPRYFLPVSNSKAYVTDIYSNTISIVDLSNNTISGHISCGGWTEELALVYGRVYITNQKNDKLYIVNTLTDMITDSITIGFASNSLKEDKNGKLWILCGGAEATGKPAGLFRINPLSNSVEQSWQFPNLSDNPWQLKINGLYDTLYFLNKDIFQMPINSASLPTSPFIAHENKNFYGLGIDPQSSIVYIADAADYVQRGTIYRYKPDGTLVNTFLAGIIPGDFCFY